MNKLRLLKGFFGKTPERTKRHLAASTPVGFTTTEPYLPSLTVKGSLDLAYDEYSYTVVKSPGLYDRAERRYVLPYRFTGRNLVREDELYGLARAGVVDNWYGDVETTGDGFGFYVNDWVYAPWITSDLLGFRERTAYTFRLFIRTPEPMEAGFSTGIGVLYDDGSAMDIYSDVACDGETPVEIRVTTDASETLTCLYLTTPDADSMEILTSGFCLYEGTGDLPDGFTGTVGKVAIGSPLYGIPGGATDTLDFSTGTLTRNVGESHPDGSAEWGIQNGDVFPPIYRIRVPDCKEGLVFCDYLSSAESLEAMENDPGTCYGGDGYVYVCPYEDIADFEGDFASWLDSYYVSLYYPKEQTVSQVAVPVLTPQIGYNVLSIGGNPTDVSFEYYTE